MWNRVKAVQLLVQQSKPNGRSLGHCAEYVRKAVEAGGVRLSRHLSAKDYGSSLAAAGFTTSPAFNETQAQLGDVAIVQPIEGHPHGHMCMFDGSYWVSDFVQTRGVYPGPAYRRVKPAFSIYRYPFPFGSELYWRDKGFSLPPQRKLAPSEGLTIYRCWGGDVSRELPKDDRGGFFSVAKPSSVIDAELRFNIADWGNRITFVSTFRLRGGFSYWIGPILHGPLDLSRPALQVYIDPPVRSKVELIEQTLKKKLLVHDGYVGAPANA